MREAIIQALARRASGSKFLAETRWKGRGNGQYEASGWGGHSLHFLSGSIEDAKVGGVRTVKDEFRFPE